MTTRVLFLSPSVILVSLSETGLTDKSKYSVPSTKQSVSRSIESSEDALPSLGSKRTLPVSGVIA